MIVKITEDCIACGLCVDICPDVFEMGEEYAEVKMESVPQHFQGPVQEAAERCPVSAIIVD